MIADLRAFAGRDLERLPWVHRILLENTLRKGHPAAAEAILASLATGSSTAEIPFYPARLLMHDTTCVPALVDIAAMRSALAAAGHDPSRLNPVLPVDVSVDHSIAVDYYARPDALRLNMQREVERNAERYRLLKWATRSLRGVHVYPPGTGIMHTINLERLATVVTTQTVDGHTWTFPDTLIGTDSHTPMINGLGVLGWGVGGLEAESVMFGMPVMLRVPHVVGVRLTGALPEGTLATDLALTVTERLRRLRLAGKFVEFFGPGVSSLSAGERAVIANMAPEYGASTGYFPIDERTLEYLIATGRHSGHVNVVEDYARQQRLMLDRDATPRYPEIVEIDLGAVQVSLAGPRRPQDRLSPRDLAKSLPARGVLAIAAITSCTNTSDPYLIVAAGLVARKARAYGLAPPTRVKTSLAPGSPTAQSYLRRVGLLEDLEAIGFGIVGYGCTTCIGNSGPLAAAMTNEIEASGAVPVAVLSGNRNFPGRVHPQIESSFLASPPLVVAYALAGDVNLDILDDPIGTARDGKAVYLRDLWPSSAEIARTLAAAQDPADVARDYERAEANDVWQTLDAQASALFPWDETSTYVRPPPFASFDSGAKLGSYIAHPLIVLGDDVTTDHISPAGPISAGSDAGRYLVARGQDARDLNVFASRRGNWEVMMRGLFTNASVRNLLDASLAAGMTIHATSGVVLPLWEAAERYRADGESVVVVAGDRYGMGSSRDWAAKGLWLLGVRAVLAIGFERIHRSNLIGMGVVPILLPEDLPPDRIGLRVGDRIAIEASAEVLAPGATIAVSVVRTNGSALRFAAVAAVETALEVELLKAGGILPHILNSGRSAPGIVPPAGTTPDQTAAITG